MRRTGRNQYTCAPRSGTEVKAEASTSARGVLLTPDLSPKGREEARASFLPSGEGSGMRETRVASHDATAAPSDSPKRTISEPAMPRCWVRWRHAATASRYVPASEG